MSQHICTFCLSDLLSLSKGNVFVVFASEVHLILRSGELVVWPQFCVMLVNKYGLSFLVCFFCTQGKNERMTDLHGSLKLKTLNSNP